MQTQAFRAYLAACAALLAAALVGVGAVREASGLVLEVATVAAGAASIVVHGRGRRLPWVVLTLGLTLFAGADAAYVAGRYVEASAAVFFVADVGYLAGYVLLGVACHLLARTRDRAANANSLLDASIVMVALAAVLLDLLVSQPLGEIASPLSRVVTVGAPLLMAVALALCARVVFVWGAASATPWLLLFAGVVTTAGNVVLTLTSAPTSGHGSLWVDLLWLLGFVAVGAAALHPSATALDPTTSTPTTEVPYARLAVLAVALLAVPGSLLVDGLGAGTPTSAPAVASFLLIALVLWRLVWVVAEREGARQQLHERAERQAALVGLGERALGDDGIDELYAEAAGLVVRHTAARTCRIELPGRPGPRRAELRVPIGGTQHGFGWVVAETDDFGPGDHRLQDDQQFLKGVAGVLAGAAQRRRSEAAIRHQARHDPLTGLANRRLLAEELAARLSGAVAGGTGSVWAVFVDLDGFKAVNDVHGHVVGDALLCAVADRLRSALRPGDLLARFAGDEFVVLADGLEAAPANRLQERLGDALRLPFDLGGHCLTISGSVGSAQARPGETPEELLRRADVAMYRHKTGQRGATSADAGRKTDVGEGRTARVPAASHAAPVG